jgi:nucleoside-triphosphatase THEP1
MTGIDDRSEDQMAAAFAAAVYTPKQADKSVLSEFVTRLKVDQVSVAGILQESRLDPGDKTRTIDSVDISTGHRIPIKRPMSNDMDCGLDVANLVETSTILRDAIMAHPDLVVIEKFGDQEQKGEGLLDEIMQIIAEGIPLLIAVPEPALEIWRCQCGGLGAILPYTQDAMWDWWCGLSNG